MGKSGSLGSLFSIRSSWKRFGVSCRVSLRPEWTGKREERKRIRQNARARRKRTGGKVARFLLELSRDSVQLDLGKRIQADRDRDLPANGEALRIEDGQK